MSERRGNEYISAGMTKLSVKLLLCKSDSNYSNSVFARIIPVTGSKRVEF